MNDYLNYVEQKTILLVEDNPADVMLFQHVLVEASLAVSLQVVSNGLEAVYYLAGKEPYGDRTLYPLPAIVLTDLNMPKMSGLDLLNWIKYQPKLRHLPVVIMTGSTESNQVNAAAVLANELGVHSYLTKFPCFESVVDVIKAALSESPALDIAQVI